MLVNSLHYGFHWSSDTQEWKRCVNQRNAVWLDYKLLICLIHPAALRSMSELSEPVSLWFSLGLEIFTPQVITGTYRNYGAFLRRYVPDTHFTQGNQLSRCKLQPQLYVFLPFCKG